MEERSKKIISALIRIGGGNQILSIDKDLFGEYYPHKLNDIEGLIKFDELDDRTLLLAFVGLVRIETELGFKQSSTTPVWRAYNVIERRCLDPHLLFANWAFQYANNDYIPFGFSNRRGCVTAYEYKGMQVPNIDANITDKSQYSDLERQFVYSGLICPYCGNATVLSDSAKIYNGTSYGMVYRCIPCGAYVGCHKGTTTSMGRLADAPLRIAKHKAHHYLDQLWKPKVQKRPQVYAWLATELGLDRNFTHIGMANVQQCNQIIALSIKKLNELGKEPIPYET